MKNTSLFRRLLSVVLVLAMVGSLMVPAAVAETTRPGASTTELELIPMDPGELESHKLGKTESDDLSATKDVYKPTDVVRVSIVLEKAATLDAGFDTKGIASNASAKAYRKALRAEQDIMTVQIEKAIGGTLDVQWNLTLVANIISANVRYGQIGTIKALDGVQDVFVEEYYEAVPDEKDPGQPMMASSSGMIGSGFAWAEGYTGAGSRLAILDTGVDIMHRSFESDALEYALRKNAEDKGMSYEAYLESLNLLNVEKIDAVKDQLNANRNGSFDASKAYHSVKIPFMFNYANRTYDATHENDTAGNHGSHVAGITGANRFVKVGDDFRAALDEVLTQGVAPDAQILDMDVFEATGGTYESTYMAAIEDAIILGCDSANLSLGSSASGYGFNHNGYEPVMNKLLENDMVCVFAMGNSGMWFDAGTGANGKMYTGYIYADDVTFHTGGNPGTFTNSLAVASVNNIGVTGTPLHFGDLSVMFRESLTDSQTGKPYGNPPILETLTNGPYEYVLIEGPGVTPMTNADDDMGKTAIGNPEFDAFAALGSEVLTGKVAMCYRGSSSFYVKVDAAAKQGAVGVIIVNRDNQTNFAMALTGLESKVPAVLITNADGAAIKAQSEAVKDAEEKVLYYTGTMTVPSKPEVVMQGEPSDTVEVSSFSSYGVPGTLTMKPEILAPGGGIYSVYGYSKRADDGASDHATYGNMSGTSMATPQVNGMAGVLSQYIRENDLCAKTGLTKRQLINSLLMSTAHPVYDSNGAYWPVIRVGAGLANVADAVAAKSYILMDEDAMLFPASAKDGKVKVELGDDPKHTGEYEFSFTLYPMEGKKEFTLHTDLFTQNIAGNAGYGMLQDTATILIGSDATYEVNGETYQDVFHVDADVNMDGETDAADAQAILDKLTGELAEGAKFDEKAADVDSDGTITTYDAKLILDSATSPVIEATEPTKVTVRIKIDEGWKEDLLSFFTKGFFVQGYTYVNPVADQEGVLDVVHSIPILGFCGSWTDPSMLDRTSTIEATYGIGMEPYMGKTNINYMTITDANEASYVYMGNPYMVEESYHPERLAMQSSTTITSFSYLPIRNAYEVGYALTDAEGKVLDYTLGAGRYAPYINSQGQWTDTNPTTYKVSKSLSEAGVQEGDKVTVGFYALPEYVAMATAKLNGTVSVNGELGKEGFKTALEAGLIGDGAGIMYNVTIDDTAPVITGAMRDFITGDFTVKAKDENYVAYVAVMNKNGTTAFAEAVPQQNEAGEETETLLKLGGEKLPGEIVILVGDYAGNESAYRVNLGGEKEDLSGSVFAFTSATAEPGKGHRMLKIDPETVTYNKDTKSFAGLSVAATTSFAVEAAEYVEGYIFMAGSDGNFYAMNVDEMEDPALVGPFSNVTSVVLDMAYNVQNQQLYVMGENNTVYTMDITSGKLTKVAEITITNPKNAQSTTLKCLAIDGKGNFYSANSSIPSGTYGSIYTSETFLYTFTLDMIDGEGKIQDLAPVNNTAYGGMGIANCEKGGSMAWDHNTDRLYVIGNYRTSYATGGYNSTVDTDNVLFVVDVANGKAARANAAGETVGTGYSAYDSSAMVYSACSGLIIVPGSTGPIKPTDQADGVTVDPEELVLLPGMKGVLKATVSPWTLTDKEVTWKSNDESVATVKNDGTVTAVAVGVTTITVTTNAAPNLSVDVPVVVEAAPAAVLRGMIWDEKFVGSLSRFNSAEPSAWEPVTELGQIRWGTLVDDTFYGASATAYIAYDEDTKEVRTINEIPDSMVQFFPSDVAPVPDSLRPNWGSMIGFGLDGLYFLYFEAEAEYNPYGFEMSKAGINHFVNDPAALIAYVGEDNGMALYFVMTEGGELYLLGLTATNVAFVHQGSTGIKLPGAASATGESQGSMVYSEETGFLYVTYRPDGDDFAYLYAIDALDPSRNTRVGDFRENVWPVVGLHEYEPATDLVLKVKPTDVSIYAGDTANVEIKVKLGDTNEYTVEVEDPTVCSFEGGVITGLQEGKTTITVTTVDTNDNGEHLSETISVEVMLKPIAIFGFETDAVEAGWTLVDADNDGNNWTQKQSASNAHTDSGSMQSYSWASSGALTPDNWLISPAIDLTEATAPVASFYVKDGGFKDTFQIYAGTSKEIEALAATAVDAPVAANSDWTKYSIDLSAFAGQSEVYVAIRHYGCSDCFYLLVDDFLVTENIGVAPSVKPAGMRNSVPLADVFARRAGTERVTANVTTGGTTAVHGELVKPLVRSIHDQTSMEGSEVQVVLTEDVAVTNGLITVNYDPTALSFVGCDSTLLYKSAHADTEKGVITFAYASAEEIAAETALATLRFTALGDNVNTEITVSTQERGDDTDVKEDDLVITVTGHNCGITHFTDIDQYPYGTEEHDAIEWAYTHKPCAVTAGTSESTFGPEEIVTRAQVMTFLWAAAGKPSDFEMPDVTFSDVTEGDYWYTPVMWAYSKGITAGNGDGTFGASTPCARAHILQFFYAAQGKPALTGENHFSDVGDDWFAPGANWAYEKGIELGEDGKFNPWTPCTRVNAVVYLYRYYSQFVENN